MAGAISSLPAEVVNNIAAWVMPEPSRNPKVNREAVLDWAKDKPSRMTPWGVQFWYGGHANGPLWIPYISGLQHPSTYSVCGRWIKDEESPSRYISYGGASSYDGRLPKITSGCLHRLGGPLSVSWPDEFAEDSLDLCKHDNIPVPAPKTKPCIITELPTELLQHIIGYLVPSNATYHFFPARVNTKETAQVVQKLVAEPHGSRSRYGGSSEQAPRPATGSAHTAIAATCRRLQNELYSLFFGHNTFIFHLSMGLINSELRSPDFRSFQSWSRTVSRTHNTSTSPMGPLGSRAMAYVRDMTLIISLPPAAGTTEINALEAAVSGATGLLREASSLHSLTIDLQHTNTDRDKRFTSQILTIDTLEARVEANGKLVVAVREPRVQPVRRWNKAQNVLRPLLHGPTGVKSLVLSGPISEDFARELESVIKAPPRKAEVAGRRNTEVDHIDSRPSKRRRI